MNIEDILPYMLIPEGQRIRNSVKVLSCPMHGKARKTIAFDYDRDENITEIEVSGCCCKEFAQMVADKLEPFGIPVVLKDDDGF